MKRYDFKFSGTDIDNAVGLVESGNSLTLMDIGIYISDFTNEAISITNGILNGFLTKYIDSVQGGV